MSHQELIKEITSLMDSMYIDFEKSHVIKNAAQRARVKSIKLQKLMKKFREVSIRIKGKKSHEN